MGTYSKDISMKDVKDFYKSLLDAISVLVKNKTSIGFSYVIMCLYEYLILSICVRYKDSGRFSLRVKDDSVIINIYDVKRCFNDKYVYKFMYSLMKTANTLKHSLSKRDMMNRDFVDLICSNYVLNVLNSILSEEEKELRSFLLNKKLINSIYTEIYESNKYKISCDEIVNFYIKNSSNGKTIECIINEMMESSGCSFKFACVEFVKCTRKEVIDF